MHMPRFCSRSSSRINHLLLLTCAKTIAMQLCKLCTLSELQPSPLVKCRRLAEHHPSREATIQGTPRLSRSWKDAEYKPEAQARVRDVASPFARWSFGFVIG